MSVPKRKGVVGGLAFDPTGKDLFAAVPWAAGGHRRDGREQNQQQRRDPHA